MDEKGWESQGKMPKWVKEEVSYWIVRLDDFFRPADKTFGLYPGVLCVLRFWKIPNRWQGEQEGSREEGEEISGNIAGVGN